MIIEVQRDWGYSSSGGAESDCVCVGDFACRWAHIGWCCRSHVYVSRGNSLVGKRGTSLTHSECWWTDGMGKVVAGWISGRGRKARWCHWSSCVVVEWARGEE